MEFNNRKFTTRFKDGWYKILYEKGKNKFQKVLTSGGEPIFFEEKNDGRDIFTVTKFVDKGFADKGAFEFFHHSLGDDNCFKEKFGCRFVKAGLTNEDITKFFITDDVIQIPLGINIEKSYIYNWKLDQFFCIPNDDISVILDDNKKEWLEITTDILRDRVSDRVTLYMDPKTFAGNVMYSYLQDRVIVADDLVKVSSSDFEPSIVESDIVKDEIIKYLDILNMREVRGHNDVVLVRRKAISKHLGE